MGENICTYFRCRSQYSFGVSIGGGIPLDDEDPGYLQLNVSPVEYHLKVHDNVTLFGAPNYTYQYFPKDETHKSYFKLLAGFGVGAGSRKCEYYDEGTGLEDEVPPRKLHYIYPDNADTYVSNIARFYFVGQFNDERPLIGAGFDIGAQSLFIPGLYGEGLYDTDSGHWSFVLGARFSSPFLTGWINGK